MKALSVRQPYAWAIIHGGKTVENRSRRTLYRGPLLIHASATLDSHGMAALARIAGPVWPDPGVERFTFGALLGRVHLVDCVQHADSPWAESGAWHWILADPEPFDEPIPCRGMLGLWTPPSEVIAA